MKKLFVVVAIIALASSVCFAQQAPVAAKSEAPVQAQVKTVAGTIESCTMGDAAKGTKTELVVMDEKGAKLTMTLAANAVIYDSAMKTIAADKLVAGEKVQVMCQMTAAGANEAKQITIVK